MPKRADIKKVLVIGSGPIVIGQAAEFDYAGTQACRALAEEGIEVVLINSNPATIMTDKAMADKVYIEPLVPEVVKKIIRMEKPDSILPTLGGQTGLNLAMTLAEEGFLQQQGVKLLGANPETIKKAEDRQSFKDTMLAIGEPCIPSEVVHSVEHALRFAEEIGYPVIVRPAYTLGGSGGGIAADARALREICAGGLRLSPIHQVLIEKCIAGWKEIEYEVMRDGKGNVITVCNMENIDPVGIHTGDSIVVAPSQTLTDREYQMLRSSALNIITELGIEGGCNVQFALFPDSFEYAVIEVNPRVSRSSALASKATGYPIAKVAAKIAIGYSLDEIPNMITGKTCACFEPALDYCVVKFPRWPFDKFVYAEKTLGTQMKATGEVMAIGQSFELAVMKAVHSIELGMETLSLDTLAQKSDEQIVALLHQQDDQRIFVVYEAIKRGVPFDTIFGITMIDKWFLAKLRNLAQMELSLSQEPLTLEKYRAAKRMGFLDKTIARLSGQPLPEKQYATYKMVDTCAAEFAAQTPYFYAAFDGDDNEALEYIQSHPTDKKKVIVFGSGPIRIGQGIEFDYCCVHCAWALRDKGIEAIIANNNPETVSTDFDTGDRLYFDPLNAEYVASLIQTEQPWGVVVQFGGQTAIKLTRFLKDMGVRILGTSADAIDEAEDRERFDALLERCGIPRPQGTTVFTTEEALAAARKLGYPVLLRPSYVLGGQNMIIAHNDEDVKEYMTIITAHALENPVLIDKYLMGTETEVDAICDGEDYLIPGIMEHVERAGIHSGDSISIYPAQTLSKRVQDTIVDYTARLARALRVVGLMNIQYVVYRDEVYVIEVNPRSSRTVPYISKVTGVPMVDIATHCMLGEKLRDMGYGTGLYQKSDMIAIKVPVFSFEKLRDVDSQLGPEMKSTGEVLGVAKTREDAMLKGLVASGMKLKHEGGVLIAVRDADMQEMVPIAHKFYDQGFKIYASARMASRLIENMIPANSVRGLDEGEPNMLSLLESGRVDYLISTSDHGRQPQRNSVKLRRRAIERGIACLTAVDTARVVADCLGQKKHVEDIDMVDMAAL
nr:carbamoyl-phosphate synthase large subunit [Maliibacterium massiliense]